MIERCFSDLLPLTVNTDMGITVRIKLFTVPGQVIHNSTRRLVLQGADGVAFIADSQVNEVRANQASFKDLRRNLRENASTRPRCRSSFSTTSATCRTFVAKKRYAHGESGQGTHVLATATHGIGVVDTFLGLIASAFERLEAMHGLEQRFGLTHRSVIHDLRGRFHEELEAPPT